MKTIKPIKNDYLEQLYKEVGGKVTDGRSLAAWLYYKNSRTSKTTDKIVIEGEDEIGFLEAMDVVKVFQEAGIREVIFGQNNTEVVCSIMNFLDCGCTLGSNKREFFWVGWTDAPEPHFGIQVKLPKRGK